MKLRLHPGAGRALLIWLVLMALGGLLAARARFVTDLSAFLPAAPTAEQRVLLDQLRDGVSSRLVLIGLRGGTPEQRAAASRALADKLRASGEFDAVHNGDHGNERAVGELLFAHRYLLSPAVDAERFSVDGLRGGIDDTLSLLGTPAGSLIKPILQRDPTGETVRLAEAMSGGNSPRSEAGVWASRSQPRALLVATTRAPGSDLDGQQQALDLVRSAFAEVAAADAKAQAEPASAASSAAGTASTGAPASTAATTATAPTVASTSKQDDVQALSLELSGPGSFGVAARSQIKGEIERLALLGTIAMLGLLLLAFGSLPALGLALLPVASGVVGGMAAVGLVHGQIHGITLGFGTTLIGEAVDYAIYYLVQARAGVDARAAAGQVGAAGQPGWRTWLGSSWPTVKLGLYTSVAGFAALLVSGFSGLAQLGLFSVAGLVAATLTTRFLLVRLAPDGAPGVGQRRLLAAITSRGVHFLPLLRWPLLALSLGAALLLALGPSPWRAGLSALSPVPAAAVALDADLRGDLGAADSGSLVAVEADSEAQALERAELAGARLDALVEQGLLRGYTSPARLLPSPSTQLARQAALPDADALSARLTEATTGGPLPAARLQGFVADVQAQRVLAPLTAADFAGTPLASALSAQLVSSPTVQAQTSSEPGAAAQRWTALISLQLPEPDPGAADIRVPVQQALAGLTGTRLVQIQPELAALYSHYLVEARWQASIGALVVLALLAWHIKNLRRLARVVLPMLASVLLVLGGLTLAGQALGVLHLVGLLLVVAVGSNYALFFDHLGQQTGGDLRLADQAPDQTRNDTLASLLLANLTTVVSFGLLASSSVGALAAIGQVVAPGALLALLLSAAFLAPRRARVGSAQSG
ncbi:MAG: transporter [Burkholderiales bacterium]|nr:transporter [Burkholderiales bacterium]